MEQGTVVVEDAGGGGWMMEIGDEKKGERSKKSQNAKRPKQDRMNTVRRSKFELHHCSTDDD
jgi:hypothetical protein